MQLGDMVAILLAQGHGSQISHSRPDLKSCPLQVGPTAIRDPLPGRGKLGAWQPRLLDLQPSLVNIAAHALVLRLGIQVAIDLLVGVLQRVHLLRKQPVVTVRHRPRGLLDHQLALVALYALLARLGGEREHLNAAVLVQRRRRQHVQRRRDELHLDRRVLGGACLGRTHRRLDVLHPVVCKAGQLHIRAHLERLRRHAPLHVFQQRLLHLLGQRLNRAALVLLQACNDGCTIVGNHDLECVKCVPKDAVQRPGDGLVQSLNIALRSFSHMPHDRVYQLGLVVPLLALRSVIGGHAPLRQIDVALLLIHAQDHDRLLPPHLNELGDRTDSPARELGQQDHSLNTVVLEQLHVCAHLRNRKHLYHHYIVHLRKFVLIEATVLKSHDDDAAAVGGKRREIGLSDRQRCNDAAEVY
mmetsp:Transcript_26081/g.77375  ORF Transcript_26081/g.77375 Transcript_26081/m.77375 type:complete len:413 (-) Transcript_26081:35-1273(-)